MSRDLRIVRHCFLLWCWLSGCLISVSTAVQAQVIVQKIAEPFESAAWRVSDDNSAGGSAKTATDVAAELGVASKSSLVLEAAFSGKGFEHFKGEPIQPLTIPGITKKISLWVRGDAKQGWMLSFKDGWNRTEADGKKLEWNITRGADATWKKVTFNVPTDWVQPISISGVLTHNWESQNQKASVKLSLDQLEVETDIGDVDEETGVLKTWRSPASPANLAAAQNPPLQAPVTPLLKVNLAATEQHNVFSGVAPQFLLRAQNWRPQSANGTVQWKIIDPRGSVLKTGNETIQVDDNLAVTLPTDTNKFGVYRLDSTIAWANGKSTTSSQPFAVIPVAKVLSEAEKDASPYGLNVLSARSMMVETFRKAGIIWYRDYGFNYEWMVRAKGADKSYGGWPWYPKIMNRYEESGARVLANFQTSMKPPAQGKPPEPDLTWTREVVGMLLAFPSLRHFELDNEYDLHAGNAKAEDAIDWQNYRNYHKKFGQLVQILGGGQWAAVENGRAGVWPERVRRVVQSGDFAPVDVINSHHYTGTDAPEINVGNHNMGFSGDESVMSFFDQLRAAKKAASADGKPRQHWLTEFGWDTKAGPVVSPTHQAAYLARAYMMLAAVGTEKGFWFFDLDAPKADQFFDGCGLFTHDQMPKLSYAAFAGLTQILPKPEYLGMINAGENTWGYLFRNEGRLVATLWTLNGEKGPNVNFEGAKLYDYLANPLEANSVALDLEPIYAVGVADNSRWVRQAAYSLETPYLVSVTAGDSITANLQVKNTRPNAIRGKVRLQLPQGWTDVSGETGIAVEAGKTTVVPMTFRVGTEEQLGEKTVHLTISEGEPLHSIPLRVQIQRPIVMTVRGLKGEPGKGDVSIRLSNRSSQPLDGTLRFKLPGGWSTTTPELKVAALKPMEVRDVTAKVLWTPTWKAGEIAAVEYLSSDGRSTQQPLIPSRLTIYSAPNLVMDGDLKEWTAKTKLPDWVLGSTQGAANANVYMAWSAKGLHVALDVRDSKGLVPDPRSFWMGDVLELFIDTRDKKTPRKYEAGDHQLWLAPQLEQKRVYVGQWKRGEELAETKYDVAGIQSAAVRRGDGYVIECLLPSAMIKDFKPTAGSRLGLNLNLSVKGVRLDREVFWTAPKGEAAEQPASWGTVTLAN